MSTGSLPSRAHAHKPGPGRPKGSTNKITITSQLAAIEDSTGMPLEELVAEALAVLRKRFLRNECQPKEYLHILVHASNKLTQSITQTLNVTTSHIEEMSDQQIDAAIKQYTTKEKQTQTNPEVAFDKAKV